MRADETDAGASRGGFMPPITSRPGIRTTQSIATGDTIAPPSTWPPLDEVTTPAEAPPIKEEAAAVIEVPEEPAETFAPTQPAPAQVPAAAGSEDFFEPWADAAVSDAERSEEPAPEVLPLADFAPQSDTTVEEPTPMAEEFALESFLAPQLEEPAVEEPTFDEPIVEPFEEESVAEPGDEEVTYEAPPMSDVVTETPVDAPASSPTSDLGERLEKVAHELRAGDADAVIKKLASGDRLDALLAGLLAGFLARPGE